MAPGQSGAWGAGGLRAGMAPAAAAPAPARAAGPAYLGRLPRGLGDDGVRELLRAAAGPGAGPGPGAGAGAGAGAEAGAGAGAGAGGGGPGWRRAPGGPRARAAAGGGSLRFGFVEFSGLAELARALEVLPGAAAAGDEGLAFTVSAGVRAQLGVWGDEQRRRGEAQAEGEAAEARRQAVLEILQRHASAEASAAAEEEARRRASELAGALEREKRRETKAQKERRAEEHQAKARQAQLLGQVEERQRQRAERLREEREAARERGLQVERDLTDPAAGRRLSGGRRRRRRREQEQDARDRDEEAREAMLVGAGGGLSQNPARRPSAVSAPRQVDETREVPAGPAPAPGAGAAPAPGPAPRRVGFGLAGLGKPRGPPARRKALLGGFGGEDEDERPVRAIVPIDYSDDDEPAPKRPGPPGAPPGAASLGLDKVPRTLQGVLEREVDWQRFTDAALERTVRPWVAEKLRGLLGGGGDGEASLGEFIASKLRARAPPRELLEELAPMLDEEAAGGLVRELYQTVIRETLRSSAEGQ